MLRSVDLPAPLVPMRAWISPTCRSIDTASTAVSPPNRRTRRTARSSAGAASGPGSAMEMPPEPGTDADQALGQQRDEGDDGQAERQLPVRGHRADQRFRLVQ